MKKDKFMNQAENANAVIIQERKLLVGRDKGRSLFKLLGGGIEKDETPIQALYRELHEELGIKIKPEDLEYMDEFTGPMKGRKTVRKAQVYKLSKYAGAISPNGEIEELKWIESKTVTDMKIEWILKHKIIPNLVYSGLID